MGIEIGHFALISALIISVVQMVVPYYGVLKSDLRLMELAAPAAVFQFALLFISFLTLVYAYITSDFTVENVFRNSHSTKPLIYKLSGVWGNHEGSMLLWLLILSSFSAAVAVYGRNLPISMKATVLSVQSSIAFAFALFIIFTSNPFVRISPAPYDGKGLNPILQDPALALHPPLLYLGYVGFSLAFSFAVAALLEKRTDAAWARWVRPWTLIAWIFLTLGIAIGSWWAYYELGWGGWWFWDPVENASLMPWLSGTALLHSALVMEKRAALKVWTILLAILTFSLSLLGTFLVRSGILSSVHAFAVDPERGIFILLIIIVFTGGSLALFAIRSGSISDNGLFAPISREGSLILNNVLLTVSCGVILIGTLYPLAYETISGGDKLSVGAPYFDLVFGSLMAPLLIALPLGPFLTWKRGDVIAASQRLLFTGLITMLTIVMVAALVQRGPWLAPVGFSLGIWVMSGAVQELFFRVNMGKTSLNNSLKRLMGLPRSMCGTSIAHFGVGLMVLGIVATSAYRAENILIMKTGDQTKVAGHRLVFRKVQQQNGPNYNSLVGYFDVYWSDSKVATLNPSKRTYNVSSQTTTEAGIHASLFGDVYVVLGDAQKTNGFTVRIYFNPFVRFIWIGALVMSLGGLISLSDRRFRIGAPQRSRNTKLVLSE
ncbi:MAG: Cytochrome c-type biogenesis protein CcmF [Hyphomicrobiaceae bacterium hypho_1]